MQVTAIITRVPAGGYEASSPETGSAAQGQTVEDAISNLRAAVELYLGDASLPVRGAPLVTTFSVADPS